MSWVTSKPRRLCVLAILLFSSTCKPKVGDTCAVADVTCEDQANALACVGGRRARVACGGRTGCADAKCDQTIARAGEACVRGDACAPDAIDRLRCENGRFLAAERCGGPAGCVVEKGAIACDTSRGEAGDPCRADAAPACARDAKSVVVCAAAHLAVRTTCRGPRGCVIDAMGALRCDDSIADVDDTCDLEGQAACSSDGTAELRCVAGKFTRARICRRPPCKASDADVTCD